MKQLPHKIAFVDVETSGMSPRMDRVIDLGIILVEKDQPVRELNILLDPETTIPYWITRICNIDQGMVTGASKFSDVAADVKELLQDSLFVAHNVGFDYDFLKNEFQRIDMEFSMAKLCTVKLSRSLYPTYVRHGLDEIISRYNFQIEKRHRAYDDAKILWDFWQIVNKEFPEETIAKHIQDYHILQAPIVVDSGQLELL